MMKATVGDRIIVRSRHLDQPERAGEVIEVHGPDGGPPYLVQWEDTEHEAVFVPGPDCYIEHAHA